jgi:tRNA threonylcarbamoyladenosine biosynthesis protein TsaB
LAELTGDPARTHGQRLPGDLMRALETAHARLDDIDLLAVAAGPGSFTGLRVGIATMQGIAFSRGLEIVPVSTLEALARHAAGDADRQALLAPWIDAQRGQVFAALYGPGVTEILVPASSAAPPDTLSAWRGPIGSSDVLFSGDGAMRYRDLIAAALGTHARFLGAPALAATIARIAARDLHRAVVPHAVVPLYVRRPDAELARERRPSR